jgi:hypothetical protein
MRRWMIEQAQDEAWRRAQQQNVRRPYGVIEADHLAAILEDQQRSEARVLAEARNPNRGHA